MATTIAQPSKAAHKPGFNLGELPNAILGVFGIRTERELPYETRIDEGRFSLRYYPPHSEIRNEEVGTRDEAADRSFERLFSYIQGENWDDQKFSMTTPVLQRPSGPSRWSTSFYLEGAVENLPLPKTSAVKLYAVNSETMAVLRFSGRPTDEAVRAASEQLLEWMSAKCLQASGEPQVAQFDQPFVISFLRRNEVLIPVELARD